MAALTLGIACSCGTESAPAGDHGGPPHAADSYFGQYIPNAAFVAIEPELDASAEKEQARIKAVREAGCPPLRVVVDGESVDFPYAYASADEDTGFLELSILNGDITSCNGIRLPTKGRNTGLISFREAYSTDADWARPESVMVEEIRLDYLPRAQRFRSLQWRSGSYNYQSTTSDVDPVLLSESLDGDTVEVCIPPTNLKNQAWKGKDDLRGSRSTVSIEGTVRAKMCGPRISAEDWQAGKMSCDALVAQEDGVPIELDLFVDPDQQYGVVGFPREAGVTCSSVSAEASPLFSVRVPLEMTETPSVGIATTNTTDGASVIHNGFSGNSISPRGPRAGGEMCLHRPLYWYREGRIGFVRGTLLPKVCPDR